MIDWRQIHSVFLDMDGTLLDLHFDNHFWLEHMPRRYAEYHGLAPEVARARLTAHYERHSAPSTGIASTSGAASLRSTSCS